MSEEKKQDGLTQNEPQSLEDDWFKDQSEYEELEVDDTGIEEQKAAAQGDKAKKLPPSLKPRPPQPLQGDSASAQAKPSKRPSSKIMLPPEKQTQLHTQEGWLNLAQTIEREATASTADTAPILWWQAALIYIEKIKDVEAAKKCLNSALSHSLFIPAAELLLNMLKNEEKINSSALDKILDPKGHLKDSSAIKYDTAEFIRKQAILRGLGDISNENAEALVSTLIEVSEKTAKDTQFECFRLAFALAQRNNLRNTALTIAEKWAENEFCPLESRIEALLNGGAYAETVLGDTPKAIQFYSKVIHKGVAHTEAIRALKRLLTKTGAFQDLSETYIVEAKSTTDSVKAAFLYYSAGRILRETGGDGKTGLELIEKASELDSDNEVYLADLAEIYTQSDQTQKLSAILAKLALAVNSNDQKVEILNRLGELYLSKMNMPDKAMAIYDKALAINPYHTPSMAALGRLYSQYNKFNELAELYKREIERSTNPEVAVGNYYKLALVYEERMNDFDKAIEAHKNALEKAPNFLPSLEALAEIYRRREQWKELCEVYEKRISIESDKSQKIFLLDRIAELKETKLNDLQGAADARHAQLKLDKKYLPAIESLTRILSAQGNRQELIELLAKSAELFDDPKQKAINLSRVAEIFDEEVGDENKAIVYYEKALDLLPSYLPALRGLGRLYHKQQRWQDLISMNEKELAATDAPDVRRSRLLRTAQIYEENLGNPSKALEIYLQVLNENPTYLPVHHRLERIYEAQTNFKALAQILEKEALITESAQFRARIYYQIGEIKEAKLNDLEEAMRAYNRALKILPDFEPALNAVIHIYEAKHAYTDMDVLISEQLQTDIPKEQKAALYHRQAKLRAGPLADPARARESLLNLISLTPEDTDARIEMLRLALTSGDLMELTNSLIEAAKTAEITQSIDFYFWAGELKRFIFNASLEAAHIYVKILDLDFYHIPTLKRLAEIYDEYNVVEGLRMVLERLYKKLDAPEKYVYALRFATLLAEKYNDPTSAEEILKEASKNKSTAVAALSILSKIYLAQSKKTEVAKVLEEQKDRLEDKTAKIHALKELSIFVKSELNDNQPARQFLEEASTLDAFDKEIEQALSSLYVETKDWQAYITYRTHRIDQAVAPEIRVHEMCEIATMHLTHRNDPASASEVLSKAIALSPDDPKVLFLLGDVYKRTNRSEEAITIYEKLLALSTDDKQKYTLYLQLADLYENSNKLPMAYNSLSSALQIQPTDLPLLRHIAALSEKLNDYAGARKFYDLLTQHEDERSRIAVFMQLAEICNKKLSDPESSADYLNRALMLDRSNKEVIKDFADLLIEHENYESLIPLYEGAIEVLGVRNVQSLDYHLMAGDAYLNHLKRPESAMASYRAALDLDPENVKALQKLAICFASIPGRERQAVSTFHKLLERDPFLPEAYRRFFIMFYQLHEYDPAYCVAQILQALKVKDNDSAFFIGENKPFYVANSNRTLSHADCDAYLIPPAAGGPVRNLLKNLSPDLSKIVVASLERYEVGKNEKVKADHPLYSALERAGKILDIRDYTAYISTAVPYALAIEATDTPSLVIGSALADIPRFEELLFIAGWLLGHLHGGLQPMLRLGGERLRDVVFAVVHSQDESFIPENVNPQNIEAISKKIGKSLSRKVKKDIEADTKQIAQAKNIDFNLMVESARVAVARSALIVSNDIDASFSAYLKFKTQQPKTPQDTESLLMRIKGDFFAAEMLKFYASPKFFEIRKKLEVGLKKE